MTTFLASAARGAVVSLRCPSCGRHQVRARAPRETVLHCKTCHHPFTIEQGARRSLR